MTKIKREVGIDPNKTADDIARLSRADLLLLEQIVIAELNSRHMKASKLQHTRALDLDDVDTDAGSCFTRF